MEDVPAFFARGFGVLALGFLAFWLLAFWLALGFFALLLVAEDVPFGHVDVLGAALPAGGSGAFVRLFLRRLGSLEHRPDPARLFAPVLIAPVLIAPVLIAPVLVATVLITAVLVPITRPRGPLHRHPRHGRRHPQLLSRLVGRRLLRPLRRGLLLVQPALLLLLARLALPLRPLAFGTVLLWARLALPLRPLPFRSVQLRPL
ncbi:hypothetical protein QRX50_11365 [Amycolatopsis carbonis]|uniref:Uncharacterized protein n=1 Tax=Amycolatopsis carbonis TaxID=715471 RepID=A0A9Y2IJY8_9PSEU|nr:hypothetical protein [Amycolatopsis sp. 2-15]WIX81314.1 hypothetical protein QRX50_11365 [Amycolatopsis sp. 2-15]